MGNAGWLLRVLPEWYFSSILDPFGAGMLTAIPAAGIICLVVGLVLTTMRPDRRLWFFLLPFFCSEVFVGFAGLQRGQFPSTGWLIWTFLGVQVALNIALVVHSKRAWKPAIALALFSLSYSFFAGFVASMSFADDWL